MRPIPVTRLLLISSLIQLLVACGSSGSDSPAGAAEATHIAPFVDNGCVACHMDGNVDQPLGPSLIGVATKSKATIEDPAYTGSAATVEAYLRESILQPEAHIVAGFTPLMPKTYASSLDEEELETLVDYFADLGMTNLTKLPYPP